MLKQFISLSVLCAGLMTFAAPTVTDVVAKQRYPWNGLVDITCKVSGIDESTKGWWLSLSAAFPDSDNTQLLSKFWVIRDGEKTTDLAVQTDGNCRLLWDAKADLGQVRFTNMVVRVVVDRPKVQLWEGGPYWADTNIGAEEPWDYGYYFWWGDTVGYKWENDNDAWVASDGSSSRFSFSDNKAPTHGKSTSTLQSEGWITSDGVLAPEHDAAQAHWGGNWRMPTKTELENLDSMCTWTWTTTNGVEGYIVRGKDEYASTSIFLPAAGYGYGTWLNRPGWYGLYWSSVPGSDNDGAWSLYSYLGHLYVDYDFDDRYLGQSVRAVQGFTDFAIFGAYAGDSAPFFLDTTDEPLVTRPIVYDSSWIGGDSSATVVIADNGTEIKRMTGDGEFAWGPSVPGKRKLTYTTFIDGIAQDEVYEAVVYADWKYTTEDGKATIVETTQTSGDVTIPSEIDGYPVIGIGDGVFKNCDGLTAVTIPFSLATSIRDIFPDSYDKVENLTLTGEAGEFVDGAFDGCTSLKSIVLPDGTEAIPSNAFSGCASLETVVIPDSVLYIGTGVFEGCSSLKTTVDGDFELMSDILIGYTGSASKVVIPDGVRGIAGGVFANRTEINEVEFPSTLEFIGVDAFATCTSLKAIDLPDSVIAVNDGSFRDCTWVQSVKMPKSLKTIGDAAFENCTSLASVGIPAGVASLGVGAFSGCSVLASVTLPGGLAVLDDQVFKNCANLTEITIPASVTQIGSSVFSGCTSLLSVKFVGNAPSVASGSYDGVSASLVTYVPYESTGWDGVATSMALPKYWPSEYENSIAWWNPVHLSVAFDWNYEGGSSEALEQVVDTTYLLPDTDPTRPGAVFAGWWTAQTGGARVTPTSRVMQMQAHTLYAHWKMNEYSVSFDANGGMGTMDPIDMMVDEEKALPTCSFVRVNHVFAGWATEPEGAVVYTDGAQVKNLSYEQGAKVTLYAVWSMREWSVSDYLNAADMEFSFEGDLPWVPDTETSHDGVASLRSGAIGASAAYPDRTASTVKTTVVGAGAGSFWWKVHCEEMDAEYGDWYDYAVFTVDGTEVAKIAGDSGWQKVEYTVTGSGEHTLAWIFTRDDYDEEGAEWENAAWLDEVSWTPNPVTVTFAAGGATGEVPEAMTRYEGCEITLPGTGTLLNDGYIFVGWSDGETVYPAGAVYTLGGEDVTFTAVWELKVWTFGEAVDAEGMTFETGGDTQWFVDTAMGYTNAVSAKSGAVTSGQSSWLQTTVTGAGTLTFRWKVLGGIYRNNPFAYAKVELDGTECASAYLKSDWAEVTVTVEGSGDHIIRWTYLRTSSRTVEEGDCAWVDAVTWTPAAGADPIPELPSTATAEEVAAALGGSADEKLAANITDAANYAAYREWAQGVKTADGSAVAGAEAVKNAPNAWLSYALDTEKLIANAPVEGDVTIDTFEDAATDGAFEFTVNVKDVTVGDGALEENIRKVFDIEGAEDLATGTFSGDAVEVNAAAAEGGKVKFTVTPKCDENGGLGTSRPTKFFFKVKMK